jgi:hypothetical protein
MMNGDRKAPWDYARTVGQAHEGAVTDRGGQAEVVDYADV